MGKRTADIVSFLLSALRNLLEFGYDQVIASLAATERTHFIMDFLSAVYAQNNVRHLPVGKFQDLVVQQYAVGGQSKAELLVVRLLQASAVLHQLLYHLPVHQRLPAEEVHLQIDPVT